MLQSVFVRVAWRYLVRHPWQTILMILGITLGVAVAVAVDLANASASLAFDVSTETVAGRATHQIVGGPGGLDEGVYARLRRSGLGFAFAPVVVEYVSSPQLGGGLRQLLGIDPFVDAPFRDYLGAQLSSTGSVLGDLLAFLAQPGAALLSTGAAERYQVDVGDTLTLEIGGQSQTVTIVGLIRPADNLSQRALENLILVDIATAQELLGRVGALDRIDVILPEANTFAAEAAVRSLLPQGVQLLPVEARSGTIRQMTDAFRLNLTALSLLALVVGLFLIYNTMTFSVVQRRSLFGTLRCLGVTRAEVFLLVIVEALLVGIIGAALGLVLGVVMGQGAVRLVTRTINDLFFVVTVQGVQIPASSLIKGAVLGILATVLTAAPPALEAASVPPRAALSRSGLEVKARQAVLLVAGLGFLLAGLGGVVLFLPTRSLVLSFFGTFAIVTGFAMLAPLVTIILTRSVAPLTGAIWGVLGRMAPRDVVNSLSRTSVAIAALMVAVAVTIGVSLMVNSFRYTVQIWLEQVLQGDVYINAPTLIATQSSAPLDPQVLARLPSLPGVAEVFTLRAVSVDSPAGPVQLNASSNIHVGEQRIYLSQLYPADQMERALIDGAVVVSEPFANRIGLPREGGTLELYTDQGLKNFPVVGIFYDYASTQGSVLMLQSVYHRYWDDRAITAASLNVTPGVDVDALASQLRDDLSAIQRLIVRPNQALRLEVLEVFDRTFAITQALQLLATLVAFIGVLSALLSLELERQRELGILRAVGLTARQLWGLILLETGLLGSAAGLLAMPTGYVLAVILVYIINKRSFGWTLQMQTGLDPFLQALALAVSAAILAGVYPAWRMGRMVTAEAMRFES
jgi:putative ABC transport system permease protein